MTSPQDSSPPPSTTATRQPLNLNTQPPGKLTVAVRAWSNTSPRIKFAWLGGLLGLLTLSALVLATRSQEPTVIQGQRAREAYLLSTETPTALAGITADTPPDVALQALYGVMPQFEQWLSDAQSQHFDQLITREAQRMAAAALHEVQTGQVNGEDPARDIDLQTCLKLLEPTHCVLLRYAGDAIVALEVANRDGDVYAVSAAYIRFRAAMLALAPPPVAVADATAPMQGMLNLRIALYDLLRFMPTAVPVGEQFQSPTGDLTPAANLEAQHPAP